MSGIRFAKGKRDFFEKWTTSWLFLISFYLKYHEKKSRELNSAIGQKKVCSSTRKSYLAAKKAIHSSIHASVPRVIQGFAPALSRNTGSSKREMRLKIHSKMKFHQNVTTVEFSSRKQLVRKPAEHLVDNVDNRINISYSGHTGSQQTISKNRN